MNKVLTAEEIIEAREFLIKRLHMTPMQATMLYSDYVNACIEFSNQKLEAYKNQSAVSDDTLLNLLVWHQGKGDEYRERTLLVDMVNDFLKENPSVSESNVGGMRWVKASERLPKYQRDLHIKLAGDPYVGDFQPDDTFLLVSFDTKQRTCNFDWYDQIEWLDESIPSEVKEKDLDSGDNKHS